jgi:7-cyano-7-deazaguanine synthase in queuosine biosynthesis
MNIPLNSAPQGESHQRSEVVVLFSGGRDSSLAACLMANQNKKVHLLTCNNGISIKPELADVRFRELQEAFPAEIVARTIVPSYGLFRRVALVDIEQDFHQFKKNLILLGYQLAAHTEGILYCQRNDIKVLVSGFTRYESHYAEQLPEAIKALSVFASEYGVEYMVPVYECTSADEVKYKLLDFGISTKSLEGVSIFADTFSDPSPELVLRYIEAKLPICRDYMSFKLNL